MGDYTKLILKVKIRQDGSSMLSTVLDATRRHDSAHVPGHAFFQSPRWDALLHGCQLITRTDGSLLQMDAKVKNYGGEIKQFCDWLSPLLSAENEGQKVGMTEFLEFADENSKEVLSVRSGYIVAEPLDV